MEPWAGNQMLCFIAIMIVYSFYVIETSLCNQLEKYLLRLEED
jgi:hypothetical protein